MNIVHICLACFYVEGLQYQENILPAKHRRLGNNVSVLTSDYAFDSKGKAIKKKEKEYINPDGVYVRVLEKNKKFGYLSNFGLYMCLYKELEWLKPDIIFVHGGQFFSLNDVIRYKKKHQAVKLYIDQHGDFYNAPVNTRKKRFVQTCLYGHFIRKASEHTEKIWGVTPWRVQYLSEVYKVPENKCDLLVMGGDDSKINFGKKEEIRRGIRKRFNIAESDFLIISGGKIDKSKNIHLLIQAVLDINKYNVKLLVFGQPNDDMETILEEIPSIDYIRFSGWIPAAEVYDYYLASDLAVFPGTHSVLWEQACAVGIPCVFKSWEGMHHVDVGGNCKFLYQDSSKEIADVLEEIINSKNVYDKMKKISVEKGIPVFSYNEIAKRAIGMK